MRQETMRAIEVATLDGPAGVRPAERPVPVPGAGEVLIRVAAAGVAFPDLLLSRGAYQLRPDPPFVPGLEVAGTVVSAPPGSGLTAGDRIVAFTGLGGMAQYATAPAAQVFPLPDQLDWCEAAGLVVNHHTAWFALAWRGRLRRGETVLVHGAAGGVGSAALQVARGLGARTIAVVSSAEKERFARRAGAHEVVRGDLAERREDEGGWPAAVRALAPDGVDLVLDPVGAPVFDDSVRCLAPEGRIVVVGFAGGGIPEVRVNRLLLRNVAVVGAGLGAFTDLRPDAARTIGAAVDALVRDGHVRPLVSARLPLADAAAALRLLERRQALGKVVLTVP